MLFEQNAARYGGDEFAVILIDSAQKMTRQVAHHIGMGLRIDPEEPILSVNIGIGIGIYTDDGRTPAEVIEAANRQLYCRKKESSRKSVTAPG